MSDRYSEWEALHDIAEMVGMSKVRIYPEDVVEAVREHLNSMRDDIASREEAEAKLKAAVKQNIKLPTNVLFGKSHAQDVEDREEREAYEHPEIW